VQQAKWFLKKQVSFLDSFSIDFITQYCVLFWIISKVLTCGFFSFFFSALCRKSTGEISCPFGTCHEEWQVHLGLQDCFEDIRQGKGIFI